MTHGPMNVSPMKQLTRRRALQAALALAAAGAAVPAPASADAAFQLLPALPHGIRSAPWGVAIGRGGLVYVTDSRLHRLSVFSPEEGSLRVLATPGSGPGRLRRPQGLAVAPDGELYVVDGGNRRVQVFGPDGEFRRAWGRRGSAPGEFDAPRGAALDALGHVYVADGFNDRVQKFDRSGTFLLAWGSRGRAPGQFSAPIGVAVGPSQTVYVADTYRDRIQAFRTDGSFVRVLTQAPAIRNPIGVAVDPSERVYVTEDIDHRVVVVESSGVPVGAFGTEGARAGQFQFPRGLAVDADGRVYVADSFNHRVLAFSTDLPQPLPPTAADLSAAAAAGPLLEAPTAHSLTNWQVRFEGRLWVVPVAAYFQATGGAARWGWPISEPLVEFPGVVSQYFQRGVMDWADDGRNGRALFPRPVWDYLGGGLGGAPNLGAESDRRSTRPGQLVGTWGHRVSNVAVDGTRTGFLDFFLAYGGEPQFGAPRTEARADTGADGTVFDPDAPAGPIRQYFQNAVLEFAPTTAEPVRLRLIGESLRNRWYPAWANLPSFAPAAVQVGETTPLQTLQR